MFTNKTILITGGTGSFGNAVLERFLNTEIAEIRIFSRDEKKQDDMRHLYKNDKIKYYIGDVRDYRSIRDALSGVDFVFSAAALKQVPSCEFFPMEGKNKCHRTDNADGPHQCRGQEGNLPLHRQVAYPINAMGTSKAMMEKVFAAKSRTVPRTRRSSAEQGTATYSVPEARFPCSWNRSRPESS